MILLIKLMLAHFIGDFMLQPNSWVLDKEQFKAKSPKLYLHILLHGFLVLIVLLDLTYWPLALGVIAFHGAVDLIKLYAQKEENKARWFLYDQGMHLICLGVLAGFWSDSPFTDFSIWIQNSTFWLFTTAIVFLTAVSGIIIQILLSAWASVLEEGNEESLQNAGKYIGILERLFVFTFVVTGNWEAIGFLLAAKSVFRFGDLKESKDRKLTEYILIGTLLSFGIAIVTGMMVVKSLAVL